MKQSTKLHNWFLKFDRTFSDKIWWQIIILLGFVIVALLIGLVICYFLTFGENCKNVNFFESSIFIKESDSFSSSLQIIGVEDKSA